MKIDFRFILVLFSVSFLNSCDKTNSPTSPSSSPNNGSVTGTLTAIVPTSSVFDNDSVHILITSSYQTVAIPLSDENTTRFQINNLPPGTTSLIFMEKNGYLFSECVSSVDINPGENTDIGNVVMQRDQFINEIVSHGPGGPGGVWDSDLQKLVGYQDLSDYCGVISYFKVDMGYNEEIQDNPGIDFVVRAKANQYVGIMPITISVSNDWTNFIGVGELAADSLADYGFDLHGSGLEKARYVYLDNAAVGGGPWVYYIKALDKYR